MTADIEALVQAALAEREGWKPTWWRVTCVMPARSIKDGRRTVWIETKQEAEMRAHLARIPEGATDVKVYQLWESLVQEWREVDV